MNGPRPLATFNPDYSPVGDWTFEEAKLLEVALAHHYHEADRYVKIAARLPRRTAHEVYLYAQSLMDDIAKIESGEVPVPEYQDDITELPAYRPPAVPAVPAPKKGKAEAAPAATATAAAAAAAAAGGDRRKGVPWTPEEHRAFLLGLAKFGKGDWRNIARNFVTTRTPTQVASHAQKYFIRLNNQNKKDKRRASIHDTYLNSPKEGSPLGLPGAPGVAPA